MDKIHLTANLLRRFNGSPLFASLIDHKDIYQTTKDLEGDEIFKRSVVRSIEIIGEAVKAIPDDLKQSSSLSLEQWKKMARMRDVLAHRYFNIDYDVVFKVLKEDAPVLNREVGILCQQLLASEYQQYQQSLADNYAVDDSDYFTRVSAQEELDIAIVKKIIAEYPLKFRSVAVAKAKDIVGAGNRAASLRSSRRGGVSVNSYINGVMAKALGTPSRADDNRDRGSEYD